MALLYSWIGRFCESSFEVIRWPIMGKVSDEWGMVSRKDAAYPQLLRSLISGIAIPDFLIGSLA